MKLIAGPCVIENYEITFSIASYLKQIQGVDLLFKASYDKANRTSIHSYRGPGLKEGLAILSSVRDSVGIRITSDVHRINEIERAAEVLDVLQIPAFLFRQTDFVLEVARMGKPVNIKKGQFAAPQDMRHAIDKIKSVGNNDITIIERGTCFGYNDLVVDMRGIQIMKEYAPVIFDATHSVQKPCILGDRSGGNREFVAGLAKAAVGCGADGVFIEVHPDPDQALCDGPNSLRLQDIDTLIKSLIYIKSGPKNF